TANELIPVEVKSNSKKSKSLSELVNNTRYKDIKHGIKLGDCNIGREGNIFTFPYFCVFLLKQYLKNWK
ncbi:MAG: hypothetical protein IIZ03_08590, partial [Succinivibrionaceae bacterium]|nr:hypothetical protein [Succinivibrionaceae bacterium]